MSTTYYLTADEVPGGDVGGGFHFNKMLSLVTATPGSLSISQSRNTTQTSYGFSSLLNVDNLDGTSTGTFTIKINVTTGNAGMHGSISLSRLNSTGAVQTTSDVTAEQVLEAGVKTFSLVNPALGTWASNDRLRVNYITRNDLNKTLNINFGTGTNDESVVTPFTASAVVYSSIFGYFWD